jgi:hypothetical protein
MGSCISLLSHHIAFNPGKEEKGMRNMIKGKVRRNIRGFSLV